MNSLRDNRACELITAWAAGFIFILVIAPSASPVLMSVLTLAAWRADPGLGALWFFSYGIALGLPMVAIEQGVQRLQRA